MNRVNGKAYQLTTTTPPVIVAELARQALDAMATALGRGAVDVSPEYTRDFGDPYRPHRVAINGTAGVVHPSTTEEVQHIVRIATSFGVPLQVSSQGRNFGYGGAEPRVDGAISVSLRRMNRILEIDDELGYVELEPGVSFFELYEALRDGNHPYMMSGPDLGWGSVLGNALDHGIGYTPRGDHNGSLCGLEVVMADGSVIRTGMGGLSGSRNWHAQKRGFGPSLDGLFGQSNFGVVTRAGIWLHPMPKCYTRIQVCVPHEADIEKLVDTVRPLVFDGTIRSFPTIVHGFADVAGRVPREDWPVLHGWGTEEQIGPVVAGLGTGMWTLRASLYGREDIVASDLAHVRAAFESIPGAVFTSFDYQEPYSTETVAPPHRNGAGIPSLAFLDLYNAWGGREKGGHIDFSPVTPYTGRDALTVHSVLSRIFAKHGVQSVYAVITRERSLAHVNMLMYNTDDEAAVAASRAAWEEASAELAEHGFGIYRGHSDYADDTADTYDFGDHSIRRVYDSIKDALDPHGVLSPGKQGIWPASMRPSS